MNEINVFLSGPTSAHSGVGKKGDAGSPSQIQKFFFFFFTFYSSDIISI